MKRPLGVVLSCVALGLVGLCLLLATVGLVSGGVTMHRHPTPNQPPSLEFVLYGMGVVAIALATWVITTLVGLNFMRGWARYSLLALGGLMAFFGGLCCLGTALVFLVGRTGSGVPRQEIILGIVALFYGGISALGVWWLVYFNRRSIRPLFQDRVRLDRLQELRFQAPRKPSLRPTAVTIVGCLFVMGAVMNLLMAMLPFPAFVAGHVYLKGNAHIAYAVLGVTALLSGIGILRLHTIGRVVAFAFTIFGFFNVGSIFVPGYRLRMMEYMATFRDIFPHPAGPAPVIPISVVYGKIVAGAVFGLIFCIAQLWVLIRYRSAFNQPPPPLPEISGGDVAA